MKVYSSLLVVTVVSTLQITNAQNPGPCTLCIDGSTPPFLQTQVFDFGANQSTCETFAMTASGITVEDEGTFLACRQLQDVGLSNCGCETPAELKTNCTLCPGGNDLLPFPDQEVIPHVTCSGIAKVVERFEGNECRAYQQVIGGMCGCPDAPTTRLNGDETCRVCSSDRPVDNPAAAVDLSEFGLDAVPCAFFETIANEDDETPCSIYQLSRAACCDMPTVPPAAPFNLEALCALDTISANLGAYLACASACVEASCCEDSCSTDPGCFQYFPCLVLELVDAPEGDGSDGGSGGDNDGDGGFDGDDGPPAPPSNLAALCKEETVTGSYEAYLSCATECTKAQCCLDSCQFSTLCLQYIPCLVLENVDPPQAVGTEEPNNNGDGGTTDGGSGTTPPTADDSGASGHSGRLSFRLMVSVLLTMAVVGIAEYGI